VARSEDRATRSGHPLEINQSTTCTRSCRQLAAEILRRSCGHDGTVPTGTERRGFRHHALEAVAGLSVLTQVEASDSSSSATFKPMVASNTFKIIQVIAKE